MNSRIARFALSGYRIAGMAAYPFARPYLSYRAAKGKEDKRRRMERFGYPSAERPRAASSAAPPLLKPSRLHPPP